MKRVFLSGNAEGGLRVSIEDDTVTISSDNTVLMTARPGELKHFDGGWVETYPLHAQQMFKLQLEGRLSGQLEVWRDGREKAWKANGFVEETSS